MLVDQQYQIFFNIIIINMLEYLQLQQEAKVEQAGKKISFVTLSLESATIFPFRIYQQYNIETCLNQNFLKLKKLKYRKSVIKLFVSDKNKQYIEILFWYLLALKVPLIMFKNKKSQERVTYTKNLLIQLKNRLIKAYVELFISVPSPKQALSNILLFINGFFIIMKYKDIFQKREIQQIIKKRYPYFSYLRFILDIFQITIYEALGIQVSDLYIETNLNKLIENYQQDIQFQIDATKNFLEKSEVQKGIFDEEYRVQCEVVNNDSIMFKDQLQKSLSITDLMKSKRSEIKLKKINSNIGYLMEKREKSIQQIYLQIKNRKKSKKIEEIQQQKNKQIFFKQTQTNPKNFHKKIGQIKQNYTYNKLGPCISKFLNNNLTIIDQKKNSVENQRNITKNKYQQYEEYVKIANLNFLKQEDSLKKIKQRKEINKSLNKILLNRNKNNNTISIINSKQLHQKNYFYQEKHLIQQRNKLPNLKQKNIKTQISEKISTVPLIPYKIFKVSKNERN